MSKIKIVTAVSNWDCYKENIKNNSNMNNYELITFDNSKDSVPITKRFNDYIRKNILNDKIEDNWIIFCHEDFAFMQDPMDILSDLDGNAIYSTIGYKRRLCGKLVFRKILGILFPCTEPKAKKIGETWGVFDPNKINEQKNIKNREAEDLDSGKTFKCGDKYLRLYGKKIKKPTEVETLSSCCLIIHSSLIKKEELLFDEELDFFMYGEELSLRARFEKGIKVYVVPCESRRVTDRNLEREGKKKQALEYIKSKYNNKKFCTSYDCYPNIVEDKK